MKSASTAIHNTPHAAQAAQRRAEIMALWCVSPAVALMMITIIAPFVLVFIFSLTDYELGQAQYKWVWLSNFWKVINDPEATKAIWNTIIFSAIVVPGSVGLGLIFALLVNSRNRTRRFYEILFFLPISATSVVMAVVWTFLFQDSIGPIASLFRVFGFPSPNFLTSPNMVLISLSIVGIWQQLCFCFILFLAGLTTIPQEIYEAAALDGADRGWEKFRRITWPYLAPTTLVVVLLTTLHSFRVFDLVVVMTRGGPGAASEVILYKTYLEGFEYFHIGYGSALTIIFVVMTSSIALLQFIFARRRRAA